MGEHNSRTDTRFKLGFILTGSIALIIAIFATFLISTDFSLQEVDWQEWAVNFAINVIVSVLAIFLALNGVTEILKSKEEGSYQRCFDSLNELTEEVYSRNELVTFDGFVPWMEGHETRKAKINYLTRAGIDANIAKDIVDYASTSDIPTISGYDGKGRPSEAYGEEVIRKDRDGNDVYIPAIKGIWAKPVSKVLSNKVRVFFPNSAYFLTAFPNVDDDVSTGESALKTERKRRRLIRSNIASRIVSLALTSALLGVVAVDISLSDGWAEKLWSFISHLLIAITGFVNGGVLACTSVNYLVKELKDKIKMIRDFHQYLNSGEYKPVDYEEEKRRKIAKHNELIANRKLQKLIEEQEIAEKSGENKANGKPKEEPISVDGTEATINPSSELNVKRENYSTILP